jgi:uncharacterized protein YqeY
MQIKDQLQKDLVESMKAKDETRLSTIRMLKSAITNWEIAKSKDASDEDVVDIISTQVKQRKDAAEQYREGDREEQAAKEEAEIKVLMGYMPEQLNEDEVRELVKEAIAATGAESEKDMGKVMGALMPKVKGKADGGMVSRLVKEGLAQK